MSNSREFQYILKKEQLAASSNPTIKDIVNSDFYILAKTADPRSLAKDIYRNSMCIDANGKIIDQSIYFNASKELDGTTYATDDDKRKRLEKEFEKIADTKERLQNLALAYNQNLISGFCMATKRAIQRHLVEGTKEQVEVHQNSKFYLKDNKLISKTTGFDFKITSATGTSETTSIQTDVEMVYELVEVDQKAYIAMKEKKLAAVIADCQNKKQNAEQEIIKKSIDGIIQRERDQCIQECKPENIPKFLFKLTEVRTKCHTAYDILMGPPKKKLSWGLIITGSLAVVAGAITMGLFGVGTPLFFMGVAILCSGSVSTTVGGVRLQKQLNKQNQFLARLSAAKIVKAEGVTPSSTPANLNSPTSLHTNSNSNKKVEISKLPGGKNPRFYSSSNSPTSSTVSVAPCSLDPHAQTSSHSPH